MRWGLHYGGNVEHGHGVYTVLIKEQPIKLPDTVGLVRINWGYHPEGTVPPQNMRGAWVNAVVETIMNNQASGWIIGNEPNNSGEWPAGQPIAPEYYAGIVSEIWIKAPRTSVILACLPDPYHSNPRFPDPFDYMNRMFASGLQCDGFVLHIKAFGSAARWPIHGDVFRDPPFTGRPYGLGMLSLVLAELDKLYPGAMVYLTEVNHQDDPSPDFIGNLIIAVETLAHNFTASVAGGFIYNCGVGDRWDICKIAPRERLEASLMELGAEIPVGWLIWPVKGHVRVTQRFGVNPKRYQPFGLPGHEGIDLVSGSLEVRAAASGWAEPRVGPVYGNHVVQRAVLPIGGKLFDAELVYAHLQSVYVKGGGEWVGAGAPIGVMGATGRATGVHLHFGVRILANKDDPVWHGWANPMLWLPPTFKEVQYV